ncbi:hypothetical protein AAFC00_006934 [Neodothiora populina]|uniref:G protein-coupled receptor GPR1 n=1 Tax=Neodothiora populina TaxID=2781224 RepID=A0ABR3PCV9_9PEZI
MGLGGHLRNPSTILTHVQSRSIQIVAVSFAAVSVFACLITLYWFLLMKRNFRRSLILNLILSDTLKSIWYLVFAAVSLQMGAIKTSSDFCQANGFLLQAAIESCDVAILLISVHMYLQIFSSTSKLFGHDGLYRFRHTALAVYVLWPILSASLAFVNDQSGYVSNGPFCTLPIRPFWYRLALTWIPRYLIWIYVMFVVVRIYVHVGSGFSVFATPGDQFSSNDVALKSEDLATTTPRTTKAKGLPGSFDSDDTADWSAGHGDVSPGEVDRQRLDVPEMNWAVPSFAQAPGGPAPGPNGPEPGTESRRGSRVAFRHDSTMNTENHPFAELKRNAPNVAATYSFRYNAGDVSPEGVHPLAPIQEVRTDAPGAPECDQISEDTPLKKRRRAIQRQLRLLFIYPVAYMIMWAIPFVYHSMNYSNYYARHPVYGLALVAAICQCSLGAVDCIIFGFREKPWRQIPGSDGSFVGSFMFWRFRMERIRSHLSTVRSRTSVDQEANIDHEEHKPTRSRSSFMRSTSYNSIRHSIHKKTFSGSSDRTSMAAEQAAQRLALEREDRENKSVPPTRNTSVTHAATTPTEWWDRRLSEAVLGVADEDDHDDRHN